MVKISAENKRLLMQRHNAAMRLVKKTSSLDDRIDLLIAVVAPSSEVVRAQAEKASAASSRSR